MVIDNLLMKQAMSDSLKHIAGKMIYASDSAQSDRYRTRFLLLVGSSFALRYQNHQNWVGLGWVG